MNGKTAILEHVENLIAATKVNPMKKSDSTIYRESLKQALGCFVSPESAAAGMHQFDQLAQNGKREQMATEVVLNTLGLHEAKAGVAEYIAGQLEKLSTVKSPERDGIRRVKQVYSRLKANVQKGAITVGGEDLTDWARKEAAISIPPELRDERWSYQATASLNGKIYKNLGLETVGGGRKV